MKFTQLEYIHGNYLKQLPICSNQTIDRWSVVYMDQKLPKTATRTLYWALLDRTTDNLDLNSDNVQKSAEPTKNEI